MTIILYYKPGVSGDSQASGYSSPRDTKAVAKLEDFTNQEALALSKSLPWTKRLPGGGYNG